MTSNKKRNQEIENAKILKHMKDKVMSTSFGAKRLTVDSSKKDIRHLSNKNTDEQE